MYWMKPCSIQVKQWLHGRVYWPYKLFIWYLHFFEDYNNKYNSFYFLTARFTRRVGEARGKYKVIYYMNIFLFVQYATVILSMTKQRYRRYLNISELTVNSLFKLHHLVKRKYFPNRPTKRPCMVSLHGMAGWDSQKYFV